MLCSSALSTQDEFANLLTTETPGIFDRVDEAWGQYRLAKQDWDNFVYALGAFPSGVSPAEGALIVNELAERERHTLAKMAEALQELYDSSQPQERFAA